MKQLWRWSISEREMYSSILVFRNDKQCIAGSLRTVCFHTNIMKERTLA